MYHHRITAVKPRGFIVVLGIRAEENERQGVAVNITGRDTISDTLRRPGYGR